ncbi:acyltransferase [Clavibacter lycopersici]|uniref:Acyltransferase n=1 Tax=Clavibacter lycopersici TaxID=2301718 RepID=A0A399TCH3_9MICO|nr:acyltransferase [Clavibacter lycopersici]RIJ52515.1 acyltransferase [Clavibacter lycopersici]RIJ62356.1 acyltransferase [Clavibacter lycopersici]
MSAPTARPRPRADNRVLNVFRSAAALAVVLGHVRLLFFEDYATAAHDPVTAILYSLTSLGSEAVIVFFVMSGYWVGGSVIAGFRAHSFSWGRYASARLTRLWLVLVPALLLTLLLDLVGAHLLPAAGVYADPTPYESIPADPSYAPLTFLGNVAFMQGLHVPVLGTNSPLWSLAYEAWYYLLFPALLAAFWPGGSVRRRAMGAVLVLVAVVVSGPLVLGLFPAWVLGAVVAALAPRLRVLISSWPPRLLAVARGSSIPLIVLAAVAAHEVSLPFRLGALILAAVTALGISLFVTDVTWTGRAGRLLGAAGWTAHSSYSLYAIHMPIVVLLAAAVVPSHAARWTLSPGSVAGYLAVIAVCCLVAYVFARFTERKTDVVRARTTSLIGRMHRATAHPGGKAPDGEAGHARRLRARG